MKRVKAKKTEMKQEANMWQDTVFVSRQKEIHELSDNFSYVLDQMLVHRPLVLDKKLLDDIKSESDASDSEHNEEEEFNMETTIHEQALLLMHEIDQMKRETHELITWFRPNFCKSNLQLRHMKQGVEQLYEFLSSLRIRAENLLSI